MSLRTLASASLLALLLALVAPSSALAQQRSSQCTNLGGYPFVPGGCLNARDLDAALELSPGVLPPQNAQGLGAGQWKFWLDKSTLTPTLRQCISASGCGTTFVPSEWTSWATINPSNGAIVLSPAFGAATAATAPLVLSGNTLSLSLDSSLRSHLGALGINPPLAPALGGSGCTSPAPSCLNSIGGYTPLNPSSNLSDVSSASISRSNLGLGTMATQNAGAVAITGGTISGASIVGGPGASSILSLTSSTATPNFANPDAIFFAGSTSLAPPALTIAPSYNLAGHWRISSAGYLIGIFGAPSTSQLDATYNAFNVSNVRYQGTNIAQGIMLFATLPSGANSPYNFFNATVYDQSDTHLGGGVNSAVFTYVAQNNLSNGSALSLVGGQQNGVACSSACGAMQIGVVTDTASGSTFGFTVTGGGDGILAHNNGYAFQINSGGNPFATGVGWGVGGGVSSLTSTGTAMYFANTMNFGTAFDFSAMTTGHLSYVWKGPANSSYLTGAGAAVFATVNKYTLVQPATTATLAIADTKSFEVNNTMVLQAATDGNFYTFPGLSDTVATLTATQTFGSGSTWHGAVVGLTYGGTGANLTASTGGVVYSGASALAVLSGTATANLPLLSGASAAPAWASVGYPTSATSGGVAYFSSTAVMASSGLMTANAFMTGGGAGAAPNAVAITGLVKGNGASAPSAAVAGTDYAAATTGAANLPLFTSGSGGFTNGTRSGSTTTVGTTSGALTSGDGVKIDASGNLVDSGAVMPAAANPTATGSDVATNGVATTFMRSDASFAIQKLSNTVFGLGKVDNSTITASAGVITAASTTVGGATCTPGGSCSPGVTSFAKAATFNLASGSVTQALTGFGFKPSSCVAFGQVPGSALGVYTSLMGVSDSARNVAGMFYNSSSFTNYTSAFFISAVDSGGSNKQQATIASYDSDGLTLSWTSTGSPTGTLNFTVACVK